MIRNIWDHFTTTLIALMGIAAVILKAAEPNLPPEWLPWVRVYQDACAALGIGGLLVAQNPGGAPTNWTRVTQILGILLKPVK